jgi:hypothetical protein
MPGADDSDDRDYDEDNEQRNVMIQQEMVKRKSGKVTATPQKTSDGKLHSVLTIDHLTHLNGLNPMEKVHNFLINNPLC